MIQGFFVRVLQFEKLRAQRSRFLLSALKLRLRLLVLLLPLGQNLNPVKREAMNNSGCDIKTIDVAFGAMNHLVEVSLLLVEGGGQAVGALHVHHEVLHLVLEALLGFLQRGAL